MDLMPSTESGPTGTLIKLISQPIYRDAVINGKFLAGVATITIMLVSIVLVVAGFGLNVVGVVPGIEEVWRLFVYLIISIFYISFWLGLAILFSICFRSIATSALASIALWIFLSFFVSLGAEVVANTVAPIEGKENLSPDTVMKHAQIKERVGLFSPMVLYSRRQCDHRGSHEKNHEEHDPHRTHGGTVRLPFSESAPARPEHTGRYTLTSWP